MMQGPIRLTVTVQNSGQIVLDKKQLRAVLRQAGNEVAAVARKLIRSSAGTGRLYYGPGGSAAKYRGGYQKGQHRASAPGEAPSSVTGTLARSIVVRPFESGEGVAVRDKAFYALFLQVGAKGGGRKGPVGAKQRGKAGIATGRVLQPRPFLTTALEMREGSLGDRVRAAVIDGVKFERVRA